MTFSYLEVYNENIRDLLAPSSTFLDLREDPIKGMSVAGIQEVEARSHVEVHGVDWITTISPYLTPSAARI